MKMKGNVTLWARETGQRAFIHSQAAWPPCLVRHLWQDSHVETLVGFFVEEHGDIRSRRSQKELTVLLLLCVKMEEIVASVADFKFEIESQLYNQVGVQALPFPGMDSTIQTLLNNYNQRQK